MQSSGVYHLIPVCRVHLHRCEGHTFWNRNVPLSFFVLVRKYGVRKILLLGMRQIAMFRPRKMILKFTLRKCIMWMSGGSNLYRVVLVLAVFWISCTRAQYWCIHRNPTLWLVSLASLCFQMSCYFTSAALSVMAYLVNTYLLFIGTENVVFVLKLFNFKL